jgi:hypothetical protein
VPLVPPFDAENTNTNIIFTCSIDMVDSSPLGKPFLALKSTMEREYVVFQASLSQIGSVV